jgi:hypothetical protein
MRLVFVSFILCVAACASPDYLGQPVTDVGVSGSMFRVYTRTGTGSVEAHRTSFEVVPSRSETLIKAARAIEIATRCKIKTGTLHGDQAIILAEVDCILP